MFCLLLIQGIGLVSTTANRIQADHAAGPDWSAQRASVAQSLFATQGRHLVLVRYEPGHSVHREWVFNEADPMNSKVVWARWNPEINDDVIAAYSGRKVWILDVDSQDAGLLAPIEPALSR